MDTGDLYALSSYDVHQVALDRVERGQDIVIVCPCGPFGPGDRGPTPTGRFLLTLANSPIWLDSKNTNNIADVRDMATAHYQAAKRGRTGESYLLGAFNLDCRELGLAVGEVLGFRRPFAKVPLTLLKPAGYAMKFWADNVSNSPPLLTPAAARIGKKGLRADCSKAIKELGMPQTPIQTAIQDALVWFAENGYIKNRRVLKRLL